MSQVRVYADGVFDLFHYGHAKVLEQAKKAFPHTYLLVGVCNDRDTHKYKGPTVMTWEERCESVKHCKWVDEIVYDAPWKITDDFLKKYNIDFVAHDDIPYPLSTSSNQVCEDVYADIKKQNKFYATQRTEDISTTDLIERILTCRDVFVTRNEMKNS